MALTPKLFVSLKNDNNRIPDAFRQIEEWTTQVSTGGGGGGYASLTGPGQTTTPGDLTQAGGFTVIDSAGHGISLESTGGGIVEVTTTNGNELILNPAGGVGAATLAGNGVSILCNGSPQNGIIIQAGTSNAGIVMTNGLVGTGPGGGIQIEDSSPTGIGITGSGTGALTIQSSSTGPGGALPSMNILSGNGLHISNGGTSSFGMQIVDGSASGMLIQENGTGPLKLKTLGGSTGGIIINDTGTGGITIEETGTGVVDIASGNGPGGGASAISLSSTGGIGLINNDTANLGTRIYDNSTHGMEIAVGGHTAGGSEFLAIGITDLSGTGALTINNQGGGGVQILDGTGPTTAGGIQIRSVYSNVVITGPGGINLTSESPLGVYIMSNTTYTTEGLGFFTGGNVSHLDTPSPLSMKSFGFTQDGHIYYWNGAAWILKV